ncbi:hypothetical protein BN946_scf184909.g87 [Trametes cinnabarina]|uniref:Uncharacterized protein n=1 Tax=Pycnoporus cinnabarinus TaxID=5643 RepID=A0A060SGE7_PYCCI|nr:hypothetical protein BN946_scf184909.g87 [Trametes cinnabarina]
MVHGLQFRKRLNAEESGSDAHTDMVIWLIFNIGGDQVLLTLLIATFLFSRKIARHPTVLNVCCIWTLTGIIASLLWVCPSDQ